MNPMKKFMMGWMLFWMVTAVSCVHKVEEIHISPQTHAFTMLIAGDASEFKDAVREKIIQKYRALCEIQVLNIEALPRIDAKPYDVVVIMDTCLAWSRFNTSVKSFLDDASNRKKTVLAMTAGDPDWQFRYKGVDAITSASVLADEQLFFARIDGQIQRIIDEQRP